MKKTKVALTLVSCLAIAGGIMSYQAFSSKNSISNNSGVIPEIASTNGEEHAAESKVEENAQEFDRQVITHADFATIYNDLDSLKKDATIVVEGEVTDTSIFMHKVNEDVVPYTIYELEVAKVFSGDVRVGDIIRVAEYGGIITAEEAGLDVKFPEMTQEEKEQKIHFSFGTPLSVKGDQLLIFASNADGYQILNFEESYYMLINEYQGKLHLNVENNSYSRDIPDSKSNISDLKMHVNDFNSTFSALE